MRRGESPLPQEEEISPPNKVRAQVSEFSPTGSMYIEVSKALDFPRVTPQKRSTTFADAVSPASQRYLARPNSCPIDGSTLKPNIQESPLPQPVHRHSETCSGVVGCKCSACSTSPPNKVRPPDILVCRMVRLRVLVASNPPFSCNPNIVHQEDCIIRWRDTSAKAAARDAQVCFPRVPGLLLLLLSLRSPRVHLHLCQQKYVLLRAKNYLV